MTYNVFSGTLNHTHSLIPLLDRADCVVKNQTSIILPGPSLGQGKIVFCCGGGERQVFVCVLLHFMMVVRAACGWSLGPVRCYATACTITRRGIPYVASRCVPVGALT